MSTKGRSITDKQASTSPPSAIGERGAQEASEIRTVDNVPVDNVREPEGLLDALTATPPPAGVSGIELATATPKKKRTRKPSVDGKPRTRRAKSKNPGESVTPPPAGVTASPRAAVPSDQMSLSSAAVARHADTANDASAAPADLDEEFFRTSSVPPVSAPKAILELETRDPRAEQIASAAARARRAHLAKYVKAAIAVSLVLCLAAVLRVAIRRNHADPETVAMAATSPRPLSAPPVAPAPPNPEPAVAADPSLPSDPTPAIEPTADPAAAAATQPAKIDEPPPPVAAAPTSELTPATVAAGDAPSPEPVAAPDAPAEPDPKAAKKEKLASQIALERGKNDAAIEAGERSVKLDPTDGEAWLILGAAYQAKGKALDARRCFTACLKEGKRGPKGECAAMLR